MSSTPSSRRILRDRSRIRFNLAATNCPSVSTLKSWTLFVADYWIDIQLAQGDSILIYKARTQCIARPLYGEHAPQAEGVGSLDDPVKV